MKRFVLPIILVGLFVFYPPNHLLATVLNRDAMSVDFNISSPGARANAMGGAFIGLADDATAAFTNPAGLVVLTKPELAVEYKHTNTTVVTYAYPDGYEREFSDNTTSGISFLSFSYPLEKANVTVFRHKLVNSETNIQRYTALLTNNYPVANMYSKFNVTTYGVSGAYRLTNKFSLGFSVGFNELDLSIINTPIPPNTSYQSWGGNGWSESYTASLLWAPHDLFNLGMVYRYGPKFKYSNNLLMTNTIALEDTTKIPDVFGVGISSRPSPGLTLVVDLNYIWYSQLMKNAISSFGTDNFPVTGGNILISDIKIDDNYEIRAGFEYAFTLKIPMAIRAGYAYKPDHRMYIDSNNLPEPYRTYWINATPHGDDEHVYSGGIGFVPFQNLQLDFAYSYSNFKTEYMASFVWRF